MIIKVNSVKKILISIENNNIVFSYKTNNSSINNDLINTNIISNNELIFSDIYIQENEKIISSFPQIGFENVFAEEFYLPVGQRIEPGTLEALKVTINEFKNQKVAKNSSKKLS